MLPHQLLLDGWLTLVSGREVVTNGLPAADTLTVWTSGAPWVEPAVARARRSSTCSRRPAACRLVMLGHAALVAATIAIALVAARRLGASPRNVAARRNRRAARRAVGDPDANAEPRRCRSSRSCSGLLAADSRAPSRRVFLVFPLLVLWANLHGTVVLAALFVALRGVDVRVRAAPGAGSAVLSGSLPSPASFASPLRASTSSATTESLFLEPVDPLDRSRVGARARCPAGRSASTSWPARRSGCSRGGARRLTASSRSRCSRRSLLGATAIRSLIWFAIAAVDPRAAAARREAVHAPDGRGYGLGSRLLLHCLVVSARHGRGAAGLAGTRARGRNRRPSAVASSCRSGRPTCRSSADGRYREAGSCGRAPSSRAASRTTFAGSFTPTRSSSTLLAFDRQDGRLAARATRATTCSFSTARRTRAHIAALQRDRYHRRTGWSSTSSSPRPVPGRR